MRKKIAKTVSFLCALTMIASSAPYPAAALEIEPEEAVEAEEAEEAYDTVGADETYAEETGEAYTGEAAVYESESEDDLWNDGAGSGVSVDENGLPVYTSTPVTAGAGVYTIDMVYGQTDSRNMLTRVNSFRTGDNAWEWNSDSSKKIYHKDLDPLVWDYGLERVAMQRAAEIAVEYSHTRPNGQRCFTAYPVMSSCGENIAAWYTSESAVFEGWKEENEKYSGQGHRRNILSDDFKYIGIGHVFMNGHHFWVQEFSGSLTSMYETPAIDTAFATNVEVKDSSVSSATLGFDSKDKNLSVGKGKSLTLPRAAGKVTFSTNQWSGGTFEFRTDHPKWKSGNESIAVISEDGSKVTGVGDGETTLTAYSGDYSASINLKVIVWASSVTFNKTALNLKKGDTAALTATVLPSDASNKALKWSSDNEAVCRVDENGTVTAVGGGKTVVRAVTTDGSEVSAQAAVTVSVPAEAITPDAGQITLNKGETLKINAAVYPADADEQRLSWSVDGSGGIITIESVAEDTHSALIRALKPGASGIKIVSKYSSEVNTRINVTVNGGVLEGSDVLPGGDDAKEKIWIAGLKESYTYTGEAIRPSIRVYYGEKAKLTPGTDYTVTYKNNVNPYNATSSSDPKAPSITVKLKGDYSGQLRSVFSISKPSLKELASAGELDVTPAAGKVKLKAGAPLRQELKPVVTYRGKTLKLNKDYSLIYDKNETAYCNAGTWKVTVRGMGCFLDDPNGDIEGEVILKDEKSVNLSTCKAVVSKSEVIWDGEATLIPEIKLFDKAGKEVDKSFYVKTAKKGLYSVGKASVTLSATKEGGFVGSKTVSWKVSKPDLGNMSVVIVVNDGKEVPFEKGGVKPSVKVTAGGRELKEGVDYKLSFTRNKTVTAEGASAGKRPAVTVNGTGNYKGRVTESFTICAKNLASLEDEGAVNILADDVAYKKTKKFYEKAGITVTDTNGKTLTAKKDYTVSFASPVDIPSVGATVDVTITAVKGSGYTGIVKRSIRIYEPGADLKGAKLEFRNSSGSVIKAFPYTTAPCRPAEMSGVTMRITGSGGKLIDPSEYTVVGYLNNIRAGNAVIVIRGKGSLAGLKFFTFKISSKADSI